ncbi:alpha-mannosidase [Gloeocapsopsis dulcis]|uniref:Alpha-mannosidase n=1 Tax=Gloeocapsopsis dulcis AAB1 = 1H9 TaxID=1433147 RepID=A0A6N8G1B1_9CHRO|nr:alpha-mannosidase [Gloeocapsopsis dulcis]MUL38991.1 alpha-mannosidase [Gloeocapsopsis dulcis AAB1 = 1H9]WNN90262.1 alpha-mannosidase [Gloeocapsopsis dulcis]
MTSTVSQTYSNLISSVIEKLRGCTQVNVQACWQILDESQVATNWSQAEIAQLNAREHIAWSAGQMLWLAQKVVIPHDLSGYLIAGLRLRLALTWWAEAAQIYVNGQLLQEGDLFDCSTRVLLSPAVTPDEEITVILRLVSPNHDAGALVRSLCIYESTNAAYPEPGFIADEFAVLQRYLETFHPEKLSILATALAQIDWSVLPDKHAFTESLLTVRSSVQYLAEEIKQRQIQLLGHAHLDLAWLWAISDTWEAAQRTFTSVLNLQQDFPELIFCHSTPALYAWIEEHRPDLFAAIQQQVNTGRWEIVGGLWVEPELNLVSGESIVRQLLYGQRYVLAKFGAISTVAWLPDSFGFCATLPQFFQQAGIKYFVTQKLLWNDTTKFPYGAFWWRSPDGSAILSLMSAPIGEGIDPIKMATYACNWEQQTSFKASLWLPGVGDHGGGPTRDMLEVAQRWQNSSFFPQLKFTTAQQYLQQIHSTSQRDEEITSRPSPQTSSRWASPRFANANAPHPSPLPIWQDELYLEFHRGCYTTHADQKYRNRCCEGLLYQAELFAALADITADIAYPQAELETAWKKVLFNQFHDILPGSSIPEVYAEVNPTWEEVEQVTTEITQQSLLAIASQIKLPPPPHPDAQALVVFNSLNWQRCEVVSVTSPDAQDWVVYDLDGNQLPCQTIDTRTILFSAKSIPATGYRVFWLLALTPIVATTEVLNNTTKIEYKKLNNTNSVPGAEYYSENKKNFPEDWILENEFLRVIVDDENGDLKSIFDKTCDREILHSDGGNQLQGFTDSGQYWDAWNIDPNYAQHPLPPSQLKSIQWLECGIVQNRIRVVRQLGESEFCQDYILQADSPLLKIETTVNWQARHVLVKAAFPFNFETDYATYEIPCGVIQRTTKPETPAEQAKWEVPALHWADLSTHDYGVSLLNDCKYGYDSQPHQLRLTLLRGAEWPNPDADRGNHQFTYAIYPHQGSWQQAQTVRRGYELNYPLQAMLVSPCDRVSQNLPPVGCFLDLSVDNLILMAFKQSEDNAQRWILRCYECHGEPAQLTLKSDLGLALEETVDLLERTTTDELLRSPTYKVSPWKIFSIAVTYNQKKDT